MSALRVIRSVDQSRSYAHRQPTLQVPRLCSFLHARPKPLGYPEETKREAVRLYLEGTNFRRIGRVLGVNHQSVINWINSYHAALPADGQAVAAPEVVELDELFTFVGSKKRKPTSSQR